ncbi:hypothetical protein ACQY0O_004721 [Thecaphora frezii]
MVLPAAAGVRPRTLLPRADDEATSLLPLLIVLGVFGTLAVAWFALSSCLGDDLRRNISYRLGNLVDRIRGRRRPDAGRYGLMRDDPEATAFDVAFDDDLYHQPLDQDDEDSRRYEARQSQAYYQSQ